MIELMYVKGINRVDTPYFSTIDEQASYFDSRVIWKDDTSYYPPYYHNEITLDTSAFSLNGNIYSNGGSEVNFFRANYVRITYSDRISDSVFTNKAYYYFIDNIKYVADGIVRIVINLDTIQTYLFDIEVSEAFISRRSIKRWNDDGSINRSYIRENLSQAEQEKTYQQPISGAFGSLSWIVILASNDLDVKRPSISRPAGVGLHGDGSFYITDSQEYVPSTGGNIFLIPVIDGRMLTSVNLVLGDTYSLHEGDTPTIVKLASDSRVTNIFYLPYNPFSIVSYSASSGIRVSGRTASVTESGTFYNFYPVGFSEGNYSFIEVMFPSSVVPATPVSGTATFVPISSQSVSPSLEGFGAYQNTASETDFNPLFVPALLDENYVTEEYSFNGASVQVPWHLLSKRPSSAGNVRVLASPYGNMSLYFDADETGFYYDLNAFGSANVTSLPQFDLYTDVWKNYQVSHQGSMVTDWLGAGLHGMGQMAQAGGFIASREEYGNRYEQRSALQAMRYQQRTEVYATGFDTLMKSISEAKESIEDMAIGIDQYTKGRR